MPDEIPCGSIGNQPWAQRATSLTPIDETPPTEEQVVALHNRIMRTNGVSEEDIAAFWAGGGDPRAA